MKDARILADHILASVARGLKKCLIHIYDMGVNIGNNNTFRTLFHCLRKLAQLVFGSLALGDVRCDALDNCLTIFVSVTDRAVIEPEPFTLRINDSVFNLERDPFF